jgi:hypothetical protein
MKSGPFTSEGTEAMAENAHTTPATGRRTLLAASLGLGALPVATTVVAGAEPDAELIRLAAALEANHAKLAAVPGTLPEDEFDELMTVLTEEGNDLIGLVSDMRATTLAGLRAKARALLVCARTDHDGNRYWTSDDDIMGWSLARDLVGDELADRDPRLAGDLRREEEDGEVVAHSCPPQCTSPHIAREAVDPARGPERPTPARNL